VVTVPERRFSQGYLSFVTVAHTLVDRPVLSMFGNDSLGRPKRELRIETIAHEIAHQWWGNRVGWLSYRDQWLSEALAEYSAVQFVSRISESAALQLARRARIWREALDESLEDGRTISSLGPVVLGPRLLHHSPRAYSAIVYDKGSVVFTMLAGLLGEEPFLEMLRTLASRVDNRVIDTETFIKALEHMSGRDLGDFVERYVYGTGFPSIYYDYDIVRTKDGNWAVEGEARALDVDRSHYQLVHEEVDGWNLRRISQERIDTGGLELPVPFQVALADRDADGNSKGTRRGLGGTMTIRGDGTRFRIPLDREPSEFWLDQKGEMLANFFCETRHPKQMMRRRANEMLRAGRREQARQLFERALDASTVVGPAAEELDHADIEWESRHQNVTIHLGLARLHIDEGDDDGARREMEAAEALLDRNSNFELPARLILRSWLQIREGKCKPAYEALSDYLRIRPREKKQDLEQVAPEVREQHRDADAYALLAVAAYETGHRSVAEKALKAARDRQADMSVLAALLSKP
jgi:tetratricopeptide (TPR) repeat protein